MRPGWIRLLGATQLLISMHDLSMTSESLQLLPVPYENRRWANDEDLRL